MLNVTWVVNFYVGWLERSETQRKIMLSINIAVLHYRLVVTRFKLSIKKRVNKFTR
ncbi:hypothetical protein CZ797_07025 [Pseudoalteromonas sp. JB197]|nr:hypothetical protein CZ797_07025 [Pseudoalteromonas sp. JB197]